MEQVCYLMEKIKPKVRKPSQCWMCKSSSLTMINNSQRYRCNTCGKLL